MQEKEFLKMFQMPVIEVPTNLPNIRQDLPIQAFAVWFFISIKYLNLVMVFPPYAHKSSLFALVCMMYY